ncbi:MAG: 2-amino-4-hydroxy-6-hydroxymethyldihydropteridine diphosphokinase, partial [Duncaniella sp.]|nr:2-amino-4-hydroxy-6-hydroxymethyldihydropteridine diphosphokinase [Duncaniella sp.]
YEPPNPYLNLGVMTEPDTPLDPLDILDRAEEAQRAVSTDPHRSADGSYRDRLIDIDIIAIDAMVLDHPRLTLPHPRMHLRPFVLGPMAELDPAWVHPRIRKTPAQLLETLLS